MIQKGSFFIPIYTGSEFPEIRVKRQMFNVLFFEVRLVEGLERGTVNAAAVSTVPATTQKEKPLKSSKLYLYRLESRPTVLLFQLTVFRRVSVEFFRPASTTAGRPRPRRRSRADAPHPTDPTCLYD